MTQALLRRLLSACIPLIGLAACGGSDTADRLDLADPVVRFVHAVPAGPQVTLDRASVTQADATAVSYKFASNYFDVSMGIANWGVKTTVGGLSLGSVSIDPERGTKYTIVALATSLIDAGVLLVADPYNKSLITDHARLRLVNASFNLGNADLYVNPVGTDITGANPTVAATAFNTAGPASGNDSVDIASGTYQVTVTAAGSKAVLFKGQLSFGDNKDVLLLTVPDATSSGGIKVLSKIEGEAGGAVDVPAI